MNAILASGTTAAPPPRPQVLIVDDDPGIRALYKRLLEVDGFDVSVADAAENALQVLARTTPDVVLLDFMMPGMSGPDLIRLMRARETLHEIPIVMLTADDQPESIEAGFAAGATDYLTKPVDRRIIAARLRSAISSRTDRARVNQVAETERQHEEMRAELDNARSLQRAQVARMPQEHAAWSLTGALAPCGAVGGDMFDVIVERGRTILVMIDVSGHGLASAMVASSVRSMLRVVLRSRSLTEALAMVSEHLAEGEADHYACVGLVQLDGARVSVVNAGLPPLALVDRGSGVIVRTVWGGGVPPGLMAGAAYDATTFEVAPETRLVLLSDGLTEPFGPADSVEPSIHRLGLMRGELAAPSELEATVRSLFQMEQPDDATLLVADFKGG